MLSRSLRFIFVLVVCLGATAVTAYSAKADGGRVQWHGLCIPAGKVSHLNPNSPLRRMMSQAGMDQTGGGSVTVTFSPDEMMKAIPGWTGYVPSPYGGPKLRKLLVVGFLPNTPTNSGGLTNILRDMYTLRGDYAGAKVTELGHSGVYKVQKKDDPWTWSLLLIDPRNARKPPVEDVNKWYAGDCGGDGVNTGSCDLGYEAEGFVFDIGVEAPNIKYTREVDALLSKKVRKWRAACKAKQQ